VSGERSLAQAALARVLSTPLERVRAIALLISHADSYRVTRRAWTILAIGVLAVAASGAFAVASGRSSSTFKPSAAWGVFSAGQWESVKDGAVQRGFTSASVTVVSAMPLQNGKPFAFISATKNGHTCFMVVRGIDVAAPICRLTKPLLAFTMHDHAREGASSTSAGHLIPMTDMIGLARQDVSGLITTSTNPDGRPWRSGLPLLPVPGGWAFGGGYRDVTMLSAQNQHGKILARLHVPVAKY
jgi:hypothetical protein